MTIKTTLVDGVETFEAQIDGETIQWDKGLSYARHLQTNQLLTSQVPVSDKPDEMLFIIIHQTMELWIKLILHEARIAITHINADELPQAEKTLDRISTILRHIIHSWEVLATLTPTDFLTFRGYLRKASGFQSHQYRELEFCLGVKRADLILVHNDDEEKRGQLEDALKSPSLYDELLRLLNRNGFDIPDKKLNRDFSLPYVPCEAVENAWLDIYTNVEKYWPLYSLAEKVTALEYYFQEWRFKHMKTVSRVIGHKPGTGGSSGVSYLVKALDLQFFPELWTMRTRMTAPKQGGNYVEDSHEGCPV
ncbi:tryptophan 2,3-dioxygenase [Kordiimonas sp. SCSIO 12610]|uniref:tryptophan 2,3-dioxygenase n=1 Tax=Kordiimonas sp. SCSIO 12610 TaxID=2829597 RepID=UPI00210C47ED|nr:tryptophan 2,3-dioxygenase family protein [Kordiimonas sp. SCSIO 12610]UTW54710.1 tryptophan 2,3-dioxygenase [Kordiimonas sp. SCSIO 12610]